MLWMIAVASALLTAWIVERCQRECEQWAHTRDIDL
jgi:hypothetical protein